jgi:hypothetical protein
MNLRKGLKALASQIPGGGPLYHLARRLDPFKTAPRQPLARGKYLPADLDQLAIEYSSSDLQGAPDTCVLYRIIGNDLAPRHRAGQAYANLRFILEHEPPLDGCEKRFVVNRIVDRNTEEAILELLDKASVPYLRLAFCQDTYCSIGWDTEGIPSRFTPPCGRRYSRLSEKERGRLEMRIYRHKNNYVMNNNGARNAALRDGRGRAKWVLPWDGNCFLTPSGWAELRGRLLTAPHIPYVIIPMARVTNNQQLLDRTFRPVAREEPQIAFRADATLEFNEDYFYGRRPKVELLWRLGVPGEWDHWKLEPWDLPSPLFAAQAGQFSTVGWVARLDSGRPDLERDSAVGKVNRGTARVTAVKQLLDTLDERCIAQRCAVAQRRQPLLAAAALSATPGASGLASDLRSAAEQALQRGPYSVTQKTTLPPSQNPHDYWHPAPYFWPNPITPSGKPYLRRDGRRVPGTRLYEPLSEQFDRTRLQRLFDDTRTLVLAWQAFDDERYARHAAALVRCWFLEPDTAMNPHLRYAQVRYGYNGDQGNNTGIIEMKDLYFFLDAVRTIESQAFLSDADQAQFRAWLNSYLNWLQTSAQGKKERAMRNNHGTYFDLQVCAIGIFLGDHLLAHRTLRDSRFRLLHQFEPNGRQTEELKRRNTAHYCCFNIQGWLQLCQLADGLGEELWGFSRGGKPIIPQGVEWLLSHSTPKWPFRQREPFDTDRFLPIHSDYLRRAHPAPQLDRAQVANPLQVKPVFYPHDGIKPFWQLD